MISLLKLAAVYTLVYIPRKKSRTRQENSFYTESSESKILENQDVNELARMSM